MKSQPATVVTTISTLLSALCLGLLPACSLFGEEGLSDEERFQLFAETAYVHYEQSDYEPAMSQALKGLEIEPDDVSLNLMVAYILIRRGAPNTDLVYARNILEKIDADDDRRVLLGLGNAYERLGTAYRESAEKVLAAESEEQLSEAERTKRAARLQQTAHENLTAADSNYRKVLERGPKNLKALNGCQRVSALLENYEQSIEWSARLLKIATEEQNFYQDRLGREDLTLDSELELASEVESLRRLRIETHLFSATILANHLDSPEAALEHLQRVSELDPKLPEAHSLRAQLLAEGQRYAEAVSEIERFLSLSDRPFDHPAVRRAFDLRSEWSTKASQQSR